MEENTNIEQLGNVLAIITEEAPNAFNTFLTSDFVEDIKTIADEFGKPLLEAIKTIKTLKKIASIPSMLYLRKFERYCRGITDIPLEKRQKYIKMLGRDKFNKESVIVLNIINRIEEEDKLPFLLKILEAKMDGIIDDNEYRRLMVLTDRTLYSDLLYLKDNITADPIMLRCDSDYGLVASGLLVTAGNEWSTNFGAEDNPADTGIRFNYTIAAKRLARIIFGVSCENIPSNKGIAKPKEISDEDIRALFD